MNFVFNVDEIGRAPSSAFHSMVQIVVITTDLMLTCENLEGESGRFFSIVSQTLGAQVRHAKEGLLPGYYVSSVVFALFVCGCLGAQAFVRSFPI